MAKPTFYDLTRENREEELRQHQANVRKELAALREGLTALNAQLMGLLMGGRS